MQNIIHFQYKIVANFSVVECIIVIPKSSRVLFCKIQELPGCLFIYSQFDLKTSLPWQLQKLLMILQLDTSMDPQP